MSGRVMTACSKMRTFLRTRLLLDISTGKTEPSGSEWVTEACGSPLFSPAERASGVCRSCAQGWKIPANYPADEPPPPGDA